MIWRLSWRADPAGAALADRHYNRVTSWPYAQHVKHAWAGAWVNSLFRNEGAGLSSEIILSAVAATRAAARVLWYPVNGSFEPDLGIVTFVDPTKVRSTNPGYCYLRAGFRRVGVTKGGLLAFQMLPAEMPPPAPALPRQRGEQLELLAGQGAAA